MQHAGNEALAVLYWYFHHPNDLYYIYQDTIDCGLLICNLSIQKYPQIFHRVEVRTVSGPLRWCDLCRMSDNSSFLWQWHGTPSCMNIVHLWMCMWIASFSLSISTYFYHAWWYQRSESRVQRYQTCTLHPKSPGYVSTSLWVSCIFYQLFSLAVFSHAENTSQAVVLAIHLTIKPYPLFSCPIFIFLGKIHTFEFPSSSQTWLASRFVWLQTKLIV